MNEWYIKRGSNIEDREGEIRIEHENKFVLESVLKIHRTGMHTKCEWK